MGIQILFLSASLLSSAGDENLLQVRDIWSGEALSGVRIVFDDDTLLTDILGFSPASAILNSDKEFKIEKRSYFSAEIKNLKNSDRIIYLVPIESADAITVTAPQTAEQRLAVPAHISRIALSGNARKEGASFEQLLQQQSGVHAKSYGAAGQLQTITVRGHVRQPALGSV